MKLHGVIDLHVSGEPLLRNPNFWDKVKKAFGGEPNLQTDRMRASLEASAIVEAARGALRKMRINNAVSLVIDDQVLFQDRDGKPDDLTDLFLAWSEHATVFGGEFRMLRLAVEHEEAGLRYVLEIIARPEHPADEPAARIVVSARVAAFEPRSGESPDEYRARVEPLTKDPAAYEIYKRQFESFVQRVADAMRGSLPEARVEVREAEALVQRPPRREVERREDIPPTDPRYDPYDRYYPNPMGLLLGAMVWSSIFSMGMHAPVTIINEHGHALGSAADVNPDTADAGDGWDTGGDGGDADSDGDFGGDFGDGFFD